ncbi:MAG TPA: alpha-glucosidase family protein [Alphaproteobacteria bacterium]|nr:alpha-glucosidase family protein [Alphaproteobacteria bacterium]
MAAERQGRADWWRGAVLYQVYPLSFCDSNGDGEGDLPGLASKLEHIASLGVDGIWISPFFPSPMKDFGYDVSDYCGVDPRFGTLADFDRVIARAHALGLRVIIDQVWSHTSDAHPWFRDSRSAPSADKSHWYVWADAKPDGTPPNNWLSVFGGSAWSWEPRRRQYYLHHFLPSQPQLNLRNEAVMAAVLEAGAFWLDRGVDGFRLDAIDFAFHDPQLRDNPARSRADRPARPFGLQDHVHDMRQPEMLPFLERIRAFTDRWSDRALLGEVSSEGEALHRCAIYTDAGGTRLHTAYTLGLMRREFTPAAFREAIAEAEREGDGWITWAFSNHDVVRAVTRWRNGAEPERFQRLLMALLLSLRGSICIYQGEELGLPEAELALEHLRDPYGIAFWPEFRGRDGARTPMPWHGDAPHAGFSSARPWLPVPAEHYALALDRQEPDTGAVLHAWRKFLAWRKAHPALVSGSIRMLPSPDPVLAFERRTERERVLAAFNFSAGPIRFELSQECRPISGHGFEAELEGGAVSLPGHGAFFGILEPAPVEKTPRQLQPAQ